MGAKMSDERPVDTDCRKCKSAMTTPQPPKSGEVPFPAIALEAIYQVTVVEFRPLKTRPRYAPLGRRSVSTVPPLARDSESTND